ncbi:MAG: hypothetical protein C5B47_02395 [Verrucomicrobia bacterium]|nr:MAG: hypothetical protein C5B47_02395 [Verrucomicrobiota bacterium]
MVEPLPKPRKAVLHIIPNLTVGGAQSYLKTLVDGIVQCKHQIFILEDQVGTEWEGYAIDLICISKLMRLCKNPNLFKIPFHFHWYPPFQFNIPECRKAKSIVTIQENENCRIRNANIYVTSTSAGLRYVPPRSQGVVIRPAIDPQRWRSHPVKRKKGRLIRHSTLYPHKLSDSIMQDICSYDFKRYQWRIIGVGDWNYTFYLRLRYLLSAPITLGSSDNICEELNRAWLYVYHASDKGEHYGLCFQEALACGIPIVTNDHTGAVEQIQQGETGFICSDYAEMKMRVDALYCNDLLYDELLNNLRNYHVKEQWIDFLAAYEHLYSS